MAVMTGGENLVTENRYHQTPRYLALIVSFPLYSFGGSYEGWI